MRVSALWLYPVKGARGVEVLEGMKVGEEVVVIGQAGLKDGTEVSVVTPDAPKAPKTPAKDGDGDSKGSP